MGKGLGFNTPIKLTLTRENFNALIDRHSQPIRWLQAEKCPCIQDNLRPDANCPICLGDGIKYRTPTETTRIETFIAPIDGILEITNVVWIRDFIGNSYTFTDGDCVTYADVKKGESYQVKYIENVELSGSSSAEYVAEGYYKINLPTEIIFGEVQGALLTVTATNAGTPLTITKIFRNFFTISENLLESDQVDCVYTYVNPFKFALINNNFTKSDQKFLEGIGGDGIMIFPQRWEVAERDIVVALNATLTSKDVIRCYGDEDELSQFYPYEIKTAYSVRNGIEVRFIPGVDFVLYKNNRIKWITTNKPAEDENFSITFTYNATYRVLQDIPAPRTSENNRFPRKVALKLINGSDSREGI